MPLTHISCEKQNAQLQCLTHDADIFDHSLGKQANGDQSINNERKNKRQIEDTLKIVQVVSTFD